MSISSLRACLIAGVSVLSIAACSEKTNPQASAVVVPPEPAMAAGGAILPASSETPDAATRSFFEDVTHWNMYAIDASNTAVARSRNEAVKAFAQKMVDEYSLLSKEIDPLATTAGIMPPTARDANVMAKLDALTSGPDGSFDAIYISQLETELTAAHDRDKAYVETGANDTIKLFAQKRADRVTSQLAALETLKKSVK